MLWILLEDVKELSDSPWMKKALRFINNNRPRKIRGENHVEHRQYLTNPCTTFLQRHSEVKSLTVRVNSP